jgi:hypothetical protein
MVERGLWEWGISLYGHSVKGTWRRGSFTGDPEGYVEEGYGGRHLSIGAPLGNMEGVSFTGDFEKWMSRVSLCRGPTGGPGKRGPSTGNFENSLKEGPGYGATFSMGALSGEPGGGFLWWGP